MQRATPLLYDVVVVGGGSVGGLLACALACSPATSHLRVAVLERAEPAPLHPVPAAPEARVSALTPTSVELLRAVGAWESVAGARATPFRSMCVWDNAGGAVSFDAGGVTFDAEWSAAAGEELAQPVLGHVVENRVLQGALFERMGELSGSITLHCPSAVSAVRFPAEHSAERAQAGAPPNWPTIELDDGTELRGRLMVAADGAMSSIRQEAGLRSFAYEYGQLGLVATVETARPHDTAWQRFLADGPLAMLPVGEKHSSVIWSTTAEHAGELKALSDEDFAAEVTSAFNGGGEFGDRANLPPPCVRAVGPRGAFPLAMRHAGCYVSPTQRLALVGDAGHTVHPLAGQGLNLGLYDAAVLTSSLISAVESGLDLGEAATLQGYERQQMAANVGMSAGLHSIQQLFCNPLLQNSALVSARALGMSLLDNTPFAKDLIVRAASGPALDLSRIGGDGT